MAIARSAREKGIFLNWLPGRVDVHICSLDLYTVFVGFLVLRGEKGEIVKQNENTRMPNMVHIRTNL